MKKVILFLFLIIFVMGCTQEIEEPAEKITSAEQISDDAKIITIEGDYEGKGYERQDIIYEKGGREFQNYFDPGLKNALNWVKENIKDEIFLCWWDYGHMIRGYTGNDAVIFSPSEEIMWSVASGEWDEEKSGKFSSQEKINDVALALTTSNVSKAMEIMKKYGAGYVLVATDDSDKAYVLFKISSIELTRTSLYASMLQRMINMEGIEGFELVYEDNTARMYTPSKLEN
ncbi:hypothetical protein KY347_00405 [Candidatus Woesearchaeota archaeon]|nr:hypothetical protein [Candidatus Woesearchaeota archaeon]